MWGTRYQRYLHYTMLKSRMVQYCHIFPPFCQKLKKASDGPYTLAASRCRTPFALAMGRSGFGRLCREKKQPSRRIDKHGRSVFCVLIVYSKAADFGGDGGRSQYCTCGTKGARIAGCKTPRQPQKKQQRDALSVSLLFCLMPPCAAPERPPQSAPACIRSRREAPPLRRRTAPGPAHPPGRGWEQRWRQ